MLPTKRVLFQTPTRSTKRRKTASKSTMKIPKSLLPEMKQLVSLYNFTTGTNDAVVSIPQSIDQGSGTDQRVGSHITLKRLRVYYDYSQLSLTDGVRMCVVMHQDPSISPGLLSNVSPFNTDLYTVFYDQLLPDDASVLAGTFDVPMNLPVRYNNGGGVLRNHLHIYVYSSSNGLNVGAAANIRWTVWYTDA